MHLPTLRRLRKRVAKHRFRNAADAISQRHFAQTADTVANLNRKYAAPSFGRMTVYEACALLDSCHDPSDCKLWTASQLTHVLQIVEGMERDGLRDDDLLLAAFVHDIGKILLLRGEAPENVVCMNTPIGNPAPGIGLDRLITQWNHDEYIYLRLREHVPAHVAWLIRYHSIEIEELRPCMNEQDRERLQRWLLPFRQYDFGTKSARYRPARPLSHYRDFLQFRFPQPLDF